MSNFTSPDPTDFETLPAETTAKWARFPDHTGNANFAQLVGLRLEEVRRDYSRMRVPWRDEIRQPAGMMHGGALATLVDTVVVPAIASAYDAVPVMLTLNLNLSYLGGIVDSDAIAHGWVTRRGRSIVFCEAVVTDEAGNPAVRGAITYKVATPR
ncbi:MAG: PaaI family thioesterase [Microthrixaceae bacterium]